MQNTPSDSRCCQAENDTCLREAVSWSSSAAYHRAKSSSSSSLRRDNAKPPRSASPNGQSHHPQRKITMQKHRKGTQKHTRAVPESQIITMATHGLGCSVIIVARPAESVHGNRAFILRTPAGFRFNNFDVISLAASTKLAHLQKTKEMTGDGFLVLLPSAHR